MFKKIETENYARWSLARETFKAPRIATVSPQNEKVLEFELIEPKYDLSDIIVSQSTMQEIRSVISLKRDFHKVFEEMGFDGTHRYSKKFIVNFYGESGTGKTITAHALAKEFGKKILIVDYSQVESKYVGDTPKNLKKIFEFAATENCIIFFDEADAILSRRVTNMQSATDTSVNQTRSVLLNILNEFDGDIVFATNFLVNYDPAFMRRISKHVLFELPDFNARTKLFEKYIPQKLLNEIDVRELADASIGLSAADIEKGVLMAGFNAVSLGRIILTQDDILCQMKLILESKVHNAGDMNTFTVKSVSKDYVEKQLGKSVS